MTIKRYDSSRVDTGDGSWSHDRIVLKPESTIEGFRPIVLEPSDVDELRVVGELIAVLG